MPDPAAEDAGLVETAFFAIGVVRQQYHIIFPIALIAALTIAVVCMTYLWITPPAYIAKAQLVIDRGKSTFLQQQAVLPDTPIDSAQVESEIQIVMSGRIAALAVKNLHLTEDPEFVGAGEHLIGSLKRRLGDVLRGLGLLKPVDSAKSESALVSEAVGVLLSNLQVYRLGVTFILEITYQSRNPERAVQVANAVADAYILDQMDSKYKMQRRASDWLQTRLSELRQQAVASEEAVNAYKTKNNIVTTGGASITEQEIAELNKQVVDARTKTSDYQARLNRIDNILRCADAGGRPGDRAAVEACPEKGGADFYGAVSDLLTNPIVTKLRQQYLELVNREAEFSTRYGRDHTAVVNLRNQIRDIQNSILNELKRLAESYKSDYLISKQRQDAIEKDLAKSVAQSQEKNKAQAALRELESNAQGTRSVYEVFLQRYTESLQQQTYVTTEARILAPAGGPPLQKTPLRAVTVLALSILGGLGLGFGVAFLRVVMDRVFRTGQQIETALHVPCVALVPLVKAGAQAIQTPAEDRVAADDRRTIFRNSDVFWTVVDSPLSRFAESIRSIKLAADLQQVNGLSTVIGFTSSLPNEGKTTTAAALALLMGQVGHRAIVVDCDLRNPSLTRNLAPNATTGLVEVLCGEKSVEEVCWRCQVTGLTFLPAVVKPGLLHTSEILASAATKRLFEQLRLSYDYIVVDLPPLAPIIDVRATGHLVDFYFLVVEWGVTKIDVVNHTLKGARLISEHLLGAILNKTDMDQIAHYDRLRSQYYKNEYYGRYGYTT